MVGKTERIIHLGEFDVGERIILKRILQKQDTRKGSESTWLNRGTICGLLRT